MHKFLIFSLICLSSIHVFASSDNLYFSPNDTSKTIDIAQKKQLLEMAVDSLARIVIDSGAAPGFQVFVSWKDHTLLNKAYGYQTYEEKQKVSLDDVYDLASVTKIAASTVALMKLHSEGLIDLDKKLSDYWPDFKKTNKEDITLREALSHYAKLQPYIVYWAKTVKKNGNFKWSTFKPDSTKRFNVKVADDLYLHKNYRKKIYKAIKKSPLLPEKSYVYSGLSFLLYPQIVKNLTGKDFDVFLNDEIYSKLGLTHVGFNPENFISMDHIVPTEYDSLFRKKQVHGTVHDEAAGMFGGVSGNAGLFANASDLGKLMQMLENKGVFEGQELLDSVTVNEFTSYQYPEDSVRRGLGFDKPMFTNKEKGYVAPSASEQSFGHSGFTGTFTWADPAYDLVVVFLSNRVYPTRANRKIYQLGIYRNFSQLVYDTLELNLNSKTQ